MVENIFPKDPSAVLDYPFNWNKASSPWLQSGETISSYVITVEAGLTEDSASENAGVVTVWLSGGTAGEIYDVACLINTSNGRTDERTIQISCVER